MTSRIKGLIAAGAFVAVAAAPFAASALTASDASTQVAQPCLAPLRIQGQIEQCVGRSNGDFTIGTPNYNGGNSPDSGLNTGPMVPGVTINRGIN